MDDEAKVLYTKSDVRNDRVIGRTVFDDPRSGRRICRGDIGSFELHHSHRRTPSLPEQYGAASMLIHGAASMLVRGAASTLVLWADSMLIYGAADMMVHGAAGALVHGAAGAPVHRAVGALNHRRSMMRQGTISQHVLRMSKCCCRR